LTEYATFLADAKVNVEEDKGKLEKLKKENKKIVSVNIIESIPVLDKIRVNVSGAGLMPHKPDFRIEVKIDKGTNLDDIKKKLEKITNNVVSTEPYQYVGTT
jgi:hypothetical protein